MAPGSPREGFQPRGCNPSWRPGDKVAARARGCGQRPGSAQGLVPAGLTGSSALARLLVLAPLQMDLLCFFQMGPLCFPQIFLTPLSSLVFANPPSSASSEDFVHLLFPPSSRALPKPSKHSQAPRSTTGPAFSIFSDLRSPEEPQKTTQTFPQQIQAHDP